MSRTTWVRAWVRPQYGIAKLTVEGSRAESELWVGEDRVAALGVGLDPFEAVGVHNGAPVLVHHDRDCLLHGFALAVLHGSLDGLHCGG